MMKLRHVIALLAGALLLSFLHIGWNETKEDSVLEVGTEETLSPKSDGDGYDKNIGLERLISDNEDKKSGLSISEDYIIEGSKLLRYIGGYDIERTIKIPERVTEIGAYAFSIDEEADIDLMKKVTLWIPKDVKLDENSFSKIGPMCITFEEGRSMIEKRAFQGCGFYMNGEPNIIEIILPSTIKSIGESSFDHGWYGCASITLKLNEGLEVIGDYALEGITCNLPSTVKKLGDYALNYWSYIVENGAELSGGYLELPKGLEEIGYYCICLVQPTKTIKIPASVEKIGEHPISIDFSPALCDVIVEEANQYYKNDENGWLYTKDGKTLLYAKNSFEEVIVPEGVEYVADGSLDIDLGGDGIPYSVDLPKSLKKYHRNASNTSNVEFKGDPPELVGEIPFEVQTMRVYIPKGKMKAYEEALQSWGIHFELIEE